MQCRTIPCYIQRNRRWNIDMDAGAHRGNLKRRRTQMTSSRQHSLMRCEHTSKRCMPQSCCDSRTTLRSGFITRYHIHESNCFNVELQKMSHNLICHDIQDSNFLLIHHCRKPYLVCASMCSWRRWKRTRTHGSPSQLLSSRRRSESSQIISRCYPALPTSALIPHFRQSLTMIFYPIYKGMHAFPVDLTAVVSARGAELWTPCTTEKLWQAGRVGFSEGPCVVYCPAAEVGRAGKLSVIKLTTLDQNVRMCCIIKHFITDAAWGNKYCQSFRSYICYFYESRLFILYII